MRYIGDTLKIKKYGIFIFIYVFLKQENIGEIALS